MTGCGLHGGGSIPGGSKDFARWSHVQTGALTSSGLGAYLGLFTGIKRSERDAYRTPSFTAEFKNVTSFVSAARTCSSAGTSYTCYCVLHCLDF
jgi:hypothetical protein